MPPKSAACRWEAGRQWQKPAPLRKAWHQQKARIHHLAEISPEYIFAQYHRGEAAPDTTAIATVTWGQTGIRPKASARGSTRSRCCGTAAALQAAAGSDHALPDSRPHPPPARRQTCACTVGCRERVDMGFLDIEIQRTRYRIGPGSNVLKGRRHGFDECTLHLVEILLQKAETKNSERLRVHNPVSG